MLPTSILQTFQFVFLIRKPSSAIPSLYRCFIPPLSDLTDERMLDPTELGYRELRILFEYLYPPASSPRSSEDDTPLLIDADDLLADPDRVISALCKRLRVPYSSSMLSWPSAEDHAYAKALFDKYVGYHEDALNSSGLRPTTMTTSQKDRSREVEDREWEEKYGEEAARTIREAVDLCQGDYEYLRGFRMRL